MIVTLIMQVQRELAILVSGLIGLCGAGYFTLVKEIRRPGIQT